MSKPTIAIDARPLCGPWNGTTMYIQTVVETLLGAGSSVTLLSDEKVTVTNREPFSRCEHLVIGRHHGGLWEQFDLLRHLKRSDYDLYFVGSNKGLPLLYFGKTKLILGLLDIIPIVLYRTYLIRRPIKSFISYLLPQVLSIMKAKRILTISEKSKTDIKKYFPHKKVDAILMRMPNTVKPTRMKLKADQFVYVGGVDPRKKLNILFEAFALFLKNHPKYKLVLIGKGYDALDDQINGLGIADSVIKTGYISDKEKMDIISQSRAMVYPSLYEGYGLAIAESMLGHTAIIAGRGGSQEEIGGNAVLYIDPTSAQDISEKMQRVLNSDTERDLLKKGEERLRHLVSTELDTALGEYFTKLVG